MCASRRRRRSSTRSGSRLCTCSMWRRHTLLSACEKYTNGMRIGSVMLRWTSSVVGISQNGATTNTAGMATRIIIRAAAPLPARSLRTQSRIESGSRRPQQYRTYWSAFGRVLSLTGLSCRLAGSERRLERRHNQSDQAPCRRLEHVEEVEIVAPQRDLPVVNLEHAADPELKPERAEDQRVGAFGEHSGTVGGDAMDLHLERAGTSQ